ncbi:acylphosphatase [Phenylobacterium montanum]|uniref:acylphosphatase n=1 Tax=Phenylobacterium montanum TaxID=2823693 RepID=A0A975G2R2_9CAUL|nr:acylphosphatase [Caulobacter sp. S6]QUD89412.1 acylphosphatase [Caulobacter sp. S6]
MQQSLVRLIIHGRVQGVGYRAWAVDEARRLDLSGWVRNRREGTVELVARGLETDVERLIEACQRGPAGAQVTRIERAAAEDDGGQGFHHRPTA